MDEHEHDEHEQDQDDGDHEIDEHHSPDPGPDANPVYDAPDPDEADLASLIEPEEVIELDAGVPPPLPPPNPLIPDDREFYRREAESLAAQQPERAALMWYEAACTAELMGDSADALASLETALELRPQSPWLLPLARRMLLRLRQFDRALEVCRGEVKLGGENLQRAAVLQEAAMLMQHVQGNNTRALELVEASLTMHPGDVCALLTAIALRDELAQHAAAAQGLSQLSVSLTVAQERALYLYAAGTIRETTLNDPEAAETDYTRAVEADREHQPAVLALCNLYERRGMWPQLCSTLEHLAQLTRNPRVEARLLLTAGSLHLDRTGDLELATRDLQRATAAAPDLLAPLQRLAHLYEARGQIGPLTDTLRRMLRLTPDRQGRAAVLTHIGSLLQSSRPDEPAMAIAAYRQALDEVASYLPALQALGTLYRQQGDLDSLLQIYAPEIEGSLPAPSRAARCVEMGDILCGPLQRAEDAVAWYQRALELDPGMQLALWALHRLLRQLGRHEELAQLLADAAARSEDERTRNYLLAELARLQADELQEPLRAIDTLERIGDNTVSRAIAGNLMSLYQRTNQTSKMVTFLLDQASATTDTAEGRGRRLQAAALLEHALEEFNQALELYLEVLSQDPACVVAIRGAGRIYHRLSRWNDLVKLHYHELRNNPRGPESSILLCRVGRILEDNLRQTSPAIKAYAKALEQDPSCTPALAGLERLVRSEQRWEELVDVLHRQAKAQYDRLLAADVLCRAGEVADFQLGNLERASQLYREALELAPAAPMALHGLLRVLRRGEQWSEAEEVLQRLIASAQGGGARQDLIRDSEAELPLLLLELARIREYYLQQGPQLDPYLAAAGETAATSHLRGEITRVLRSTHSGELAPWLLQVGMRFADPALAAAHLLECVQLESFTSSSDATRGLLAAREAYLRKSDDLRVIWTLERQLHAAGCHGELAALKEKEAQLELEPAVRVVKLSSAAVAYLQGDRGSDAKRVARECLNFDAHCLPALNVLCLLEEQQQSWSELAALNDRLAEACTHPQNRFNACLRAAELWVEKVHDTSRGLASLGVALTHDPGQPQAFARAEQLLRKERQFEELSRLYRRRIATCREDDARVELMRQHAHVLRDDLSSASRAITELSALLALAPQDQQALSELSDLLVAQGHWSDAAARLESLIDLSSDTALRRQAQLQQARLWLTHLHEPARARQALTTMLDQDSGDLEARRMLVELYHLEGNWEDARRTLESLLEGASDATALWALLQLTEVARVGLRDENLCASYESHAVFAALRHQPPAAGVHRLLCHFRDTGHPQQLVQAARRVLQQEPPIDSVVAAPLHAMVARLLIEDLNQPQQALELLQAQLALDPRLPELALLQARALELTDQPAVAEQQYRAILAHDVTEVQALRGLTRICPNQETVAAVAGILDLVGQAGAEETALLKGLSAAMTPPGLLDLRRHALPAGLQPVEAVLEQAGPYLDSFYSLPLSSVLADDHPAVVACLRLGRALGITRLTVSVEQRTGAAAGVGDPVPLQLERELAGAPATPAFRFWVGRALCLAATHTTLVEQLSDQELTTLLDALCGARPETEEGRQLRKHLGRLLPRKVRRQLESTELSLSDATLAGLRAESGRRADEVGQVFCRFPREALAQLARQEGVELHQIQRSSRLRKQIRFALSATYAAASASLWT